MALTEGTSPRAGAGDPGTGTDPWIDESGVLRVGRRWAPLSDAEWELLTPLVERFGRTVSHQELLEAAAGTLPRRALNVRITRLRHRLEPLGLRLINVRKRGYILDRAHDVTPGQQVYEREA